MAMPSGCKRERRRMESWVARHARSGAGDPDKREVGARAADLIRQVCHVISAVPRVVGGATGARTPDLLHAMQMLSQLSYRPERAESLPADSPSAGRALELRRATIGRLS